jgi:hypothetical protein
VKELDWLSSDDPDAMLAALGEGLSERKKRLFACACCRRVLSRIPDGRACAALEVSEAFADGAATSEQLAAAYAVAWEVYEAAMSSGEPEEPFTEAVEQACGAALGDVAEVAQEARLDPALDDEPSAADRRFTRRERKAQADLIRDIFGGPPSPPAPPPGWLTPAVLALARGIYEGRAFDRLPVLADALQDAGCEDERVLGHCRGPGPHVRGCWLVDCILGKE